MAMSNNPSSKRAGVVFFALRLNYRLSDLIVRMGSFLNSWFSLSIWTTSSQFSWKELNCSLSSLFTLSHESSSTESDDVFGFCTALANPESLFLEIFSIYIALACVSGLGVECTKTLSQNYFLDVLLPMSNCLFHYLYQTFPTINLLTSYNDKFLFSNLLTL